MSEARQLDSEIREQQQQGARPFGPRLTTFRLLGRIQGQHYTYCTRMYEKERDTSVSLWRLHRPCGAHAAGGRLRHRFGL